MVTNLGYVVHLQELSGCKAVDRFASSWCATYHVKTVHRGDPATRVGQYAFDAYQAMGGDAAKQCLLRWACANFQPIPGRCSDAPGVINPNRNLGLVKFSCASLNFCAKKGRIPFLAKMTRMHRIT